MSNQNSFFGGMPQQKGAAPQASPSGQQSLSNETDPLKRQRFIGLLEGYKDAVRAKSEHYSQPPMPMMPPSPMPPMQPPMMGGQPPMLSGQGMGMPLMPPQGMMPPQQMPQQPPMMPQQPPQPYNHGGMVDVFDPLYMDRGGFVFTTGEDGKIRTKPVFSEERGRMVSQIMPNEEGAFSDRHEGAGAGGLANVIQKAVTEKIMKPDESERNIPFTQTVVEPETSDIIGPESKPTAQDFLHDVTNVDEMRAIPEVAENVAVPLSKPDLAELQGSWGGLDENQLSGSYTNYPGGEGYQELLRGNVNPMYPNTPPPGLLDQKLYYGAPPEKKGISPEEMDQIGRMVLEGEKLSGPESDIFDMPDYDVGIDEVFDPAQTGVAGSDAPVVQRFPPEQKVTIDDLAKLILLNAQPMTFSGEEDKKESRLMNFLKYGLRGIRNKNEGGIVQGFKPGGSVFRSPEFRTNLKSKENNVSPNVKIEELASLPKTYQGSDVPIGSLNLDFDKERMSGIDFDIQLAKAAGMQPTDPKVLASYVSDPVSARNYGGGEGQLSGNYIATNYPIDHSSVVTPPYDFGRTYTEDPLANLINVSPTYPNTPPPGTIVNNNPFLGGGSALGSDPIQLSDVSQYYKSADAPPPPKEYFDEGFMKSQKSMFAPAVNKLGEWMGYKNPYDLYKATQATLDPNSMVSQIAKHRKLDQDRAEAKLAEEQRLRDMISGMLPPVAATPPPADPIITPPVEDTTPPDYTSAVVPSDRIPGFDINQISPYPTFGVPGTPTAPAIIPSGITPELLRNLFKMQGVPATAMNQGGSVNTLDNAVDNFLGSLRSVA